MKRLWHTLLVGAIGGIVIGGYTTSQVHRLDNKKSVCLRDFCMRSNRKYSFDEKINILNLIDSNHTVQSIARDFQTNKTVIHQ